MGISFLPLRNFIRQPVTYNLSINLPDSSTMDSSPDLLIAFASATAARMSFFSIPSLFAALM